MSPESDPRQEGQPASEFHGRVFRDVLRDFRDEPIPEDFVQTFLSEGPVDFKQELDAETGAILNETITGRDGKLLYFEDRDAIRRMLNEALAQSQEVRKTEAERADRSRMRPAVDSATQTLLKDLEDTRGEQIGH